MTNTQINRDLLIGQLRACPAANLLEVLEVLTEEVTQANIDDCAQHYASLQAQPVWGATVAF